MTTRRGVCLIRFDDKYGPGCLYSEGVDNHFAEKVSMKSHLSTLSLTSNPEIYKEEFIESVIPFPEEGFIAYSSFFFINDKTARGGKRTMGITTLVDRTEQMILFKKIPDISSYIKKIASDLYVLGDPKNNLSEKIKEKLNDLLNLEFLHTPLEDITSSSELIQKKIEEKDSQVPIPLFAKKTPPSLEESMNFVMTNFQEGLTKVLHALLKNERILVIGSKEEIRHTLVFLREFLPHKQTLDDLLLIPFMDAEALVSRSAEDITLHVLGIEEETYNYLLKGDSRDSFKENNIENLPQSNDLEVYSSRVIINYSTGEIQGGISNTFCAKFITSIAQAPVDKVRELIQSQIDYLFERLNQLTTIFLSIEPSKDDILNYLHLASEGELSLIISLIEENYPILLDKIIDTFATYQLPLEVFH